MTFTQLNKRLKNFLRGWLLVFGLEEGLVECATLCVKSWVILSFPCKKSYESFVNVFKINVFKVIIYRKVSASKVNVSKDNELKGKVPKKTNFLKTQFFYLEK